MLRNELDQLVVPAGLAFVAVGCGYVIGMKPDLRIDSAIAVAMFSNFGGFVLLVFGALARPTDNSTVLAAIGYAVAQFLIEPLLLAGPSRV